VFDPQAVARLWAKCRGAGSERQFSHADNMALVGVLSTGLLHQEMVRNPPAAGGAIPIRTLVERIPPGP